MNDRQLIYHQQVETLAKERGGQLLGQYINDKIKLKFSCARDHTFKITPNWMKQGGWCKKCKKIDFPDFPEENNNQSEEISFRSHFRGPAFTFLFFLVIPFLMMAVQESHLYKDKNLWIQKWSKLPHCLTTFHPDVMVASLRWLGFQIFISLLNMLLLFSNSSLKFDPIVVGFFTWIFSIPAYFVMEYLGPMRPIWYVRYWVPVFLYSTILNMALSILFYLGNRLFMSSSENNKISRTGLGLSFIGKKGLITTWNLIYLSFLAVPGIPGWLWGLNGITIIFLFGWSD